MLFLDAYVGDGGFSTEEKDLIGSKLPSYRKESIVDCLPSPFGLCHDTVGVELAPE